MSDNDHKPGEDSTLPGKRSHPRGMPDDPNESLDPRDESFRDLPYVESSDENPLPREEGSSIPTLGGRLKRREDLPGSLLSPADKERTQSSGFEFMRRVGRGTMGEVWESIQRGLWRIVAVKKLRQIEYEEEGVSSSLMSRAFQGEAMIAALLDHPNILPVYDFGFDEAGIPLLSMKMVSGKSWNEVLAAEFRELSVDDLLSRHLPILAQVSQAVAFAHSRGVMHRDLKPAQVMLGDYGEVLLTDWGLAVLFEVNVPIESKDLPYHLYPTRDYAPCPAGTPSFMAPEQTKDVPDDLGPWTDCYLLGGILYYLLTKHSPHPGSSTDQALAHAADGDIIPFEEVAPDREVPKALGELAMWALSPDPQSRPTALEFHAALRDFITGARNRQESRSLTSEVSTASIGNNYRDFADALAKLGQARVLWPGNPDYDAQREDLVERYARLALKRGDLKLARGEAERLGNLVRREEVLGLVDAAESKRSANKRNLRIFAAVIVILTIIAATGAVSLTTRLSDANSRVLEQLEQANEARLATQQAKGLAERETMRARLLLAESLASQGRRTEAVEELLHIPERDRYWEWGYLMTLAINDLWEIPFEYLDWSPSKNYAIGVNEESGLCVVKAETGQVLFEVANRAPEGMLVAYSQDESRIALVGDGVPLLVIDTAQWDVVTQFESPMEAAITAMEFSPDGKQIALGDQSGAISIVDLESGDVRPMVPHRRYIRALYWGANRLITISSNETRRCDPETGEAELLYETGAIESRWHAFYHTSDRQRRYFATGQGNSPALYGRIDSGPLRKAEVSVAGLTMSNDPARLLISCGYSFPQYQIIDMKSGDVLPASPPYPLMQENPRPEGFAGREVGSADLAEDEQHLLVYGDGKMRLMTFPGMLDVSLMQEFPVAGTRRIVLMPSGDAVWIVDEKGKTHIRSIETPYVGTRIPGGVAAFDESDQFVSAISLRWFEQRDVETGDILFVGGREYNLYIGSMMTDDDSVIYIPGVRGDIFTIEKSRRSDSAILGVYTFEGSVGTFALEPNSGHLAVTNEEGTHISLYSLEDKEARHLGDWDARDKESLLDIRYTSDGTKLVVAMDDGRLLVLQASSGELLSERLAHKSGIRELTYDRRLKVFITIGADKTVRLWDDGTLKPRERMSFPFDISGVRVSQNGKLLLAWPEKGRPVLRDLNSGHLIAKLDRTDFPMHNVKFIGNDTRVVSSWQGAARLWSTETGREMFSFERGFGAICPTSCHFIYMSSEYEGTLMKIAPTHSWELADDGSGTFRQRLNRWMIERYKEWRLNRVRQRMPDEINLLSELDARVDGPQPQDVLRILYPLCMKQPALSPELHRVCGDVVARFWMSQPESFLDFGDGHSEELFRRLILDEPDLALGSVGSAAIASGAKEAMRFLKLDAIDDPSEVDAAVRALDNMARVFELRDDRERAVVAAGYSWSLRALCGLPPDSGSGVLQRLGATPPPLPPSELCLDVSTGFAPMMLDSIPELKPGTTREDLDALRQKAWDEYLSARAEYLRSVPQLDWRAVIIEQQTSPNWRPYPPGTTAKDLAEELRQHFESVIYGDGGLDGALATERDRLEGLFAWMGEQDAPDPVSADAY
ncbi:protein kinase [bacterium]|nr:protein kinase [bacterium]